MSLIVSHESVRELEDGAIAFPSLSQSRILLQRAVLGCWETVLF
ncbi:MAG: hypothetical protein AB1589_36820 [Cyanobacteriota bacterium]